jgi:hypothetical protein
MTGRMITGHRDTETQRTFGRVACVRLCVAGAIEGVPTLCCVCSSHPLAISGAGIPAGGVRLRTPGSVARSYPTAPDASKGWVPTTSGVAYSASATPRGTDHAARTRVSESLRATSGGGDAAGRVRRTLPQQRRPRSHHEFSVSLCLWQASYLRVCLARRS